MRLKLTLLLILAVGYVAHGQSQWNWPEDEEMLAVAKEKNVIYNDARKAKNFDEAATELEWLLANTPDLNAAIYINGVKIYKALEKEAEGDTKLEYQEKVMELYDTRIKYFNSEDKVLNSKAYDAYTFYKDKADRYPELFAIFERAYQLNGDNIESKNLVAYMDVLRRYKAKGGDISDDEVLDRYSAVSKIMDTKVENGADPAKMEKRKSVVDRMLTMMVDVNCDFIENSLGPKLVENPNDVEMAKKIMGLSLTAQCTDLDIFLTAAKVVQANAPEYGMAKIIGRKLAAAKDFDGAEKYYTEAITLTEDGEKQADIYYELGNMFAKRGLKSKARVNFYETVKADPTRRKAYKSIGDLYMTSYDECKRGESRVEDRAVFIAAYNMYQKAGDGAAMANAKAQFPSIEDIFNETMSEGDSFTVGCWINETVLLQKRPES